MDDFEEDIVVVAFTDVVALLVVVGVVVGNWFCPFGVEKTTLKTLLEAAEKAVFFIVVVVVFASFLKEEEEEDTEVDEIIAWFIFACVFLFLTNEFLCGSRKLFFKKKRRDFYTTLEQVSRTSVFLTQEQTNLQKSGALVRR